MDQDQGIEIRIIIIVTVLFRVSLFRYSLFTSKLKIIIRFGIGLTLQKNKLRDFFIVGFWKERNIDSRKIERSIDYLENPLKF